jgi:hypothetical protein
MKWYGCYWEKEYWYVIFMMFASGSWKNGANNLILGRITLLQKVDFTLHHSVPGNSDEILAQGDRPLQRQSFADHFQ